MSVFQGATVRTDAVVEPPDRGARRRLRSVPSVEDATIATKGAAAVFSVFGQPQAR
jgi:hypothetical protein